MSLQLHYVGIDPDTGGNGSPTIWVDKQNGEIVLQGWKAGTELEEHCSSFRVPGHATGIPEGEAVIRIPARMVSTLREACDVADPR